MNTKALIIAGVACFGGLVLAAPQTFDFKDPKGVNNAVFKLDAPLEAISGNATGSTSRRPSHTLPPATQT